MRIGWLTIALVALLLVTKVGMMQWRAQASGGGTEALPFEAKQDMIKAGSRPIWKPILL